MDDRKAIKAEASPETLKEVENALIYYFGGHSETLLACSPELARFLARQLLKVFQGGARFVDEGFRE